MIKTTMPIVALIVIVGTQHNKSFKVYKRAREIVREKRLILVTTRIFSNQLVPA